MTQFAKFIDTDTIKRPPRKLVTPNLIAFNFDKNETLLRQEGYLPLQYDEQPECEENEYLVPHYELCSETIEEENEDGQFVDINRQYIAVHWTVEEAEETNED